MKKKKMSALDKYIIFSFVSIIMYTVLAYIVVIFTGYQLDVLTSLFFAFFGGEITVCALIKKLKLKNYKKESDDHDEGRVDSDLA